MSERPDFSSFYASDLQPALEALEVQRKGILTKVLLTVGVCVLVGLAIGALLFTALGELALMLGLLVAGGGSALAWRLLTRDYVHAFKHGVIAPVIRYVDPSLSYAPEHCIGQGAFQNSTLFQHSIDRYRGEDYVEGTVDKTAIRFSEVHAEYKTTTRDSKGHTRTQWHTIFKGLFFVADFNKHFQGRTVVLPDRAQKFFGRFAQTLQSMNIARDDLVKMEDPEFEREFVVYGTDQVEARYILSTSLMRRILEFRRKINVPVYIAFVSSNVYLAIDIDKNLFEPRLFRTLLDPKLVADYLEDVILAVGIVEDLNLNTRIWTKA